MSQIKIFDNPIMSLTGIRMVEIEVFSYCNRKCWFCPNSFIDRSSSISYMDEGIYCGVLKNLAMVKFQKTISYSRYNEPLADPIIFTRVTQARKSLPKAYLHLNTNGDYLTRDVLEELRTCGLNSIKIQHYLSKDENFDVDRVQDAIEKMAKKLKIKYVPFKWNEDKWHEAFWHSDAISCERLDVFRTNRGYSKIYF